MAVKIGGNIVQIGKKSQVYASLLTGLIYAVVYCLFRIASKEPIHVGQLSFQVIFFTLCWYFLFFRWPLKKQTDFSTIAEDPTVRFYGAAHYRIKKDTIKGRLYATDKQLIFEPNTTDFVESPWTIDWGNIEQVKMDKIGGTFACGILIYTKGKRSFKFVVNEPQVWIETLQSKIELQ